MAVRTLAHLADLRIGESEERELAAQALCDALLQANVDHVVVTGDLTATGSYREMLRFEQLFAPVLQGGRMTLVPGPRDRRGDDAGAHLMRSRRVIVTRRPGLYLVRVDATGQLDSPGASDEANRVLSEVMASLDAAPAGHVRALLLHHPLPAITDELAGAATTDLGARLLAQARGRCDLVLHGSREVPREFRLAERTPRPLAVYDAGSSTGLRRFRLFSHQDGEQTGPPRWLSAAERPRSAALPPRAAASTRSPFDPPARPAPADSSASRVTLRGLQRAPVATSTNPAPFRFALPPSLGTRSTGESAERLQRHLSEALGRPVEVTVADSYESLARGLTGGKLSAAWAPPYVCARVESQGVRALVRGIRRGASTYRAGLVCRTDALARVSRLGLGLTALWVDRDSVAGYLLALAHLRSRGLEPSRIFSAQDFAGSYKAALEGVLEGKADLTSVFAAAPVQGEPDWTGIPDLVPGRARELSVFAFTDEAPNDGVVVSASVPQAECQVLEGTLLAMQDSLMGLGLLKSAFSVERFEKAPPRGYRVLYRVALAGV